MGSLQGWCVSHNWKAANKIVKHVREIWRWPIISRVLGPDKTIKAPLCLKQGLERLEVLSGLHHQTPHSILGPRANPQLLVTPEVVGEEAGLAVAKVTPQVSPRAQGT